MGLRETFKPGEGWVSFDEELKQLQEKASRGKALSPSESSRLKELIGQLKTQKKAEPGGAAGYL
ncbi:MAG: hypothetical protein HYW89_01020 [Candidatus Sungiibacteriota bacterium]|uniref:Uncharacterized protein n=1 Tax=Candidatus Sungiibacteriota bacterium TaxID=2750080 RepID=A0A7T5RJW1_9BACT|nr:MAG: hypothetical protein HYW89_01020 [Candidatus Sungbacteria bacterium]